MRDKAIVACFILILRLPSGRAASSTNVRPQAAEEDKGTQLFISLGDVALA
jgi:hypothetical protein